MRAKLPGMRIPALLWIPLISLAIAACSGFKNSQSTEKKTTVEGPELVGRIASIPADKRFVLIQSYGTWKIDAGTILTTRGADERTANLLITGEALGQFAAADLQSGSVEIGDAVYSIHFPKPPKPLSMTANQPELPESQQQGNGENVQKNN